MIRILITGSRNWEDEDTIRDALIKWTEGVYDGVTLVSGACPTGADVMCEKIAEEFGWMIERHPADWANYGKQAGYRRNAEMVNLGADLCLAFIRGGSKGSSMTANMALKNHIPLVIHTHYTAATLHLAGMT